MRLRMNWEKPAATDFWKAVETYLALAYDGTPPAAVRSRLDTLGAVPFEAMFQSAVFELTPKEDPIRLSLRLGNRWYPHMKLVIERSPHGNGSLFRADSHDRHIQVDPASREYAAFRELRENNQSLSSRIESEWESGGLPTFKSFLRQDLARRQNARRTEGR